MPGSRVRVPPLLLIRQPLGRLRSSGFSRLALALALRVSHRIGRHVAEEPRRAEPKSHETKPQPPHVRPPDSGELRQRGSKDVREKKGEGRNATSASKKERGRHKLFLLFSRSLHHRGDKLSFGEASRALRPCRSGAAACRVRGRSATLLTYSARTGESRGAIAPRED